MSSSRPSDDDSFLARWARRKADARARQQAAQPDEPVVPSGAGLRPVAGANRQPESGASLPPSTATPGPTPAPRAAASSDAAPPTLRDVEALTPDGDFRPFMAREVAPEVKNAALKKLFADPRFNVQDGLDVYIDDYAKPDPIPAAMLRALTQSRLLGLFDEPREEAGADRVVASDVSATAADDPCAVPPGGEGQASAAETSGGEAQAAPVSAPGPEPSDALPRSESEAS
jgi:hypothetical protein